MNSYDARAKLYDQINALLDELHKLEATIGTEIVFDTGVSKWELVYAADKHRLLALTLEQCERYEWCAEQLFAAGLIPEATVPALAAYALDKIQGLLGEYIASSLLRGNKHTVRFASEGWRMATYGQGEEKCVAE